MLQFPKSLPEFQRIFPDEAACAKYLEAVRWPERFVCRSCGHVGEPFRVNTPSQLILRCRKCRKGTSLTAGTVMHKSHTPLSTWFWAAYLITTQTPGESALQFQRQLGLSRYETAFTIMHKLRSGMVRPERDSIGGEYPVEIDECYVGGDTRGKGRGVHDKVAVIGSVEVRSIKIGKNTKAKGNANKCDSRPATNKVYAGRLRLQVIPDKSALTITSFVKENVILGATVLSDGSHSYNELSEMGYKHIPLVIGGDPAIVDALLPMIHLVFSNLKSWILGTHHGRIEPYHLQAYLNEYVFRFNRRFYPMTAFNSVLGLAAHSLSPTYAQLYSGEWRHPATSSRYA